MMRARLALSLLLAASASAQTTGAISGRVVDAQSDRPVVGATIVASSPALQGEESVRTDLAGEFVIALLPPGAYTLFVQADGHQAFTQEGVQIGAGRELRLHLSILPDAMLAAPVRIGSQLPVIPVTTARGGALIQREQMELIPYGREERSFEAPALSVPGFLQEGIFGSEPGATRYRVDGLDVNDPATLLQGRRLLQRFVDQVAVETGGLGARHGRSGAGIVEAVTKSGGNDLHGSAFVDWMPIEIPRRDLRYNVDGGAEIGGALERNRVWFYGGFAPVLQATTAGAETDYQYVGKLTWRPVDGQNFVLSAISDDFSLRYRGEVGDHAALVEAIAGWSHQHAADSVQAKVAVAQRAELFGRHRFVYGFDGAHEAAAGATARWGLAGFVQDTWSPVDDWFFEAGVQVDREDAPEQTEVLPRLGISWDFSGAGTSRAYAYYGRFLDPAPLDVPVRTIEDHIALGVERQIWRDLVGGAGYVHKRFEGALDGRTGYDAFTLSLAKPFSANSLLRASYTHASLRGGAPLPGEAPNQFKLDAAYAYEWSASTTFTLGTSFRAIEADPWMTTVDLRLGSLHALSNPYLLALTVDALNLLAREAGGMPPLAIRFGGRLSF